MNGFEAKALVGQEYVEYISQCSDEELKIERAKALIALRESTGRSARKELERLQKEKDNASN